jgi:hypothetical protein
MLSKIVVKIYTILLEIGLWLILLGGVIGGWQASGFFGAVAGMVVAAVFGAIVFGAFLVLDDIRHRVKAIEERKS